MYMIPGGGGGGGGLVAGGGGGGGVLVDSLGQPSLAPVSDLTQSRTSVQRRISDFTPSSTVGYSVLEYL